MSSGRSARGQSKPRLTSLTDLDREIARLEGLLSSASQSGRARAIESNLARLRRERERVAEGLKKDPARPSTDYTAQEVMDRDF